MTYRIATTLTASAALACGLAVAMSACADGTAEATAFGRKHAAIEMGMTEPELRKVAGDPARVERGVDADCAKMRGNREWIYDLRVPRLGGWLGHSHVASLFVCLGEDDRVHNVRKVVY